MEGWKPDADTHSLLGTILGTPLKRKGQEKWGSGDPKSDFPSPGPSPWLTGGAVPAGPRGGGTRTRRSVLSPGEGRARPRGHVPNLWDSPPVRPRGSPAGTSESRPAPVFTIYSQNEGEAIAGSLESTAPAPGAPSPALAFNYFPFVPIISGVISKGVTGARWNFVLLLPKRPASGRQLSWPPPGPRGFGTARAGLGRGDRGHPDGFGGCRCSELWSQATVCPPGGYLRSWGLYLPLLLLVLLVGPGVHDQHLQPPAGEGQAAGEVCATGTAALGV